MTQQQPLVVPSVSQPTEAEAPVKASAKRRAYEGLAQTQSDLSFMEMMMTMMSTSEAGEAMAEEVTPKRTAPETKSSEPKKEKPVAKVAQPAEVKPASTVETPEARTSSEKDTDMLSLDASALAPSDIKLLMNWVQNPPVTPINTANLPSGIANALPAGTLKTFEASMALQEQLKKAYAGQRPLRVNLDNDAHVILRFARDGKVSAEFVANSQAADLIYRQQLAELKDRLESKQLAYGELTVRRQRRQDEPADDHQAS